MVVLFVLFLFLTLLFTQQGRTPLHWAAYIGFEESVKILVEHGSNINLQDQVLIFSFYLFSHFYLLFFIVSCSITERVCDLLVVLFF